MAQASKPETTEIEVRSQLIPLDGMHLVLPNTAIAEVISYSKPDATDSGLDWLLGTINWRGTMIPVLAFESAHAGQSVTPGKRSRIIVLNAISGNDDIPFYGILAQGIPRLMSLTESIIHDAPDNDSKAQDYVLRHCIIDNQAVIIPDQKQLEEALLSNR